MPMPGALPLLLLGCPELQALDLSRCVRVAMLTFHHSSHSLLELQLGALLTMAMLTMALLTMAMLTMALLTMAMLTMALLTMAMLAPRAAARPSTDYSLPTTHHPLPTTHYPRTTGHCAKLSRDAISAIAESCEALQTLALLACNQVCCPAPSLLPGTCLLLPLASNHRTDLPAAPSRQLDDALLLELGTGCTRLQRLHLQHCELISERGAFYAATSCRELRELRLCGCVQLTDEEVLQARNFGRKVSKQVSKWHSSWCRFTVFSLTHILATNLLAAGDVRLLESTCARAAQRQDGRPAAGMNVRPERSLRARRRPANRDVWTYVTTLGVHGHGHGTVYVWGDRRTLNGPGRGNTSVALFGPPPAWALG
jgi:hypothetical protein